MPESVETERRPELIWIASPEDHATVVAVEVNSIDKTYQAVLADGTEVTIGSPVEASALARCLLLATRNENVPVFEIQTNRRKPT